MTVKELIEKLQTLDPNLEVLVPSYDHNYQWYSLSEILPVEVRHRSKYPKFDIYEEPKRKSKKAISVIGIF